MGTKSDNSFDVDNNIKKYDIHVKINKINSFRFWLVLWSFVMKETEQEVEEEDKDEEESKCL